MNLYVNLIHMKTNKGIDKVKSVVYVLDPFPKIQQ